MKTMTTLTLAVAASLALTGCQSGSQMPPIRTATSVDLNQFSGDWFVIASIPTFIEADAFNAVESYSRPEDGKIATTFTFNKGSFQGEKKTYRPTGFIRENTGNAVWGMQFVWPIRAEYRVVYVDDDYQQTIIGRSKRDYVWLMARSPNIDDTAYQRLVDIVVEQGYDPSLLRRVPHALSE